MRLDSLGSCLILMIFVIQNRVVHAIVLAVVVHYVVDWGLRLDVGVDVLAPETFQIDDLCDTGWVRSWLGHVIVFLMRAPVFLIIVASHLLILFIVWRGQDLVSV